MKLVVCFDVLMCCLFVCLVCFVICGFMLIELMIVIVIFVVVVIFVWCGFDQIMCGCDKVVVVMEDECVFVQMFDQMCIDVWFVVIDDEVGQLVIGVVGNMLQIVCEFDVLGVVLWLQVVCYWIVGGCVVCYVLLLIDDMNWLCIMLKDSSVEGWSWVVLMGGVGVIDVKLYVLCVGWIINLQMVDEVFVQNNDVFKVLQIGNVLLVCVVIGLQVSIGVMLLCVLVMCIFFVGE